MSCDVVVIGAGPGGLAAAAAIQATGRRVVVLDRAPHVGHTWRQHYDRLHLHTPRELSHLPGLKIPRSFGRWVSRDDVVSYLELYAAHHRLDLRLGTEVVGLARAEGAGAGSGSGSGSGAGWRVELAGGEVLRAPNVVVATGYNNTPKPMTWPGLETFTGEVVASSAYKNGRPYAGRSVLVVGPGNTGAEISTDLAECGAGPVWLAVRTAPHILPRSQFGWPTQGTGVLVRHLPAPVVDRIGAVLGRVMEPDLTAYGMPKATAGLYTQVLNGRVPVQDVGIIAAIRERRVLPVPAVEAFDGDAVVLDGGRRIRPEVVVVATGYVAALEGLVGHLGVLDECGLPVVHGAVSAPGALGLWFTGFTNPISGMFRELRIDAERIAAAVARGGA